MTDLAIVQKPLDEGIMQSLIIDGDISRLSAAPRVVDVVWVSPTDDSTIRVARIFATTIDGFGREPVPEDIDF